MHPFTTRGQALALVIAVLSPLTASAADATAEARIRQLENQVRLLFERLEAEDRHSLPKHESAPARVPAGKDAVIPSSNGRSLSFRDGNGDFGFRVGGRLQTDAAWYDAEQNDFGDGTRVRRLFLDVRGTLEKDWDYRFQYDFARPGGSDSSARGIRDAYIRYTGFGPDLTVGQFKEPFGLEHLTSSLHYTFLERGLTNVFNPDRRIGAGISGNGNRWTAAAGVFGETAQSDVADEGDEGWDLTGRFTWAPVQRPDSVLHLGIAGRHHEPEDSTSSLRFRERPESSITSVRLVDTGTLTDVEDLQSLGLEAAAVLGALSVQAEHVTTRVDRGGSFDDSDLTAWYAYGSFLLTGESRPYENGVFGRVKPSAAVGRGGIGAWEVALRYSSADLSDGSVSGGEQQNLTLGLNWYATPSIKFQGNYVRVLDIDRPASPFDGEEVDTFALRAQIDF